MMGRGMQCRYEFTISVALVLHRPLEVMTLTPVDTIPVEVSNSEIRRDPVVIDVVLQVGDASGVALGAETSMRWSNLNSWIH